MGVYCMSVAFSQVDCSGHVISVIKSSLEKEIQLNGFRYKGWKNYCILDRKICTNRGRSIQSNLPLYNDHALIQIHFTFIGMASLSLTPRKFFPKVACVKRFNCIDVLTVNVFALVVSLVGLHYPSFANGR